MSEVFFISDLHLGHKRILEFSPQHRMGATTTEEHDNRLIERIKERVSKRDLLYVLGDVSFAPNASQRLLEVPCRKILVRGNHDERKSAREWLEIFEDVKGIVSYKGFWLTHAPIHPAELRGRKNIHGHVHTNSIRDHYHKYDERYINVCVEALNGVPVSLQEIVSGDYYKLRRC